MRGDRTALKERWSMVLACEQCARVGCGHDLMMVGSIALACLIAGLGVVVWRRSRTGCANGMG